MADGSGAAPAAGEAGAADAGAGAAAATAAAGTTAPVTGAGTAAVEAVQAPAAFYSGLDEESQGWLLNKGYFGPDLTKADIVKSFPEMVKAHRGLERLIGDPTSRAVIPKDINDKEGWDALWSKLGRPADVAGYELKAPEGGDQKIADKFAELAFKNGLSKQTVQSMAPEWQAFANQVVAERQAAAETQYMANSQADIDALKAEWAGNTDAKFAAAQRAKIAYGLKSEVMDKIERAIGTKQFITLLSDIGANVSEDSGSGQGENGIPVTSSIQARAKMNDLKADKGWTAKYLAGDHEAVAEWNRLEKILAGIR